MHAMLAIYSSKDDLKKSFWECGNLVYCNINWKVIHFPKASIPPNVRSSIHPFLLYHPGAKSVVRYGIESIPSPKQQRRPLSDSSSTVSM